MKKNDYEQEKKFQPFSGFCDFFKFPIPCPALPSAASGTPLISLKKS